MSDLHAQLSEAKLAELLKHGTESEILDFKEVADLGDSSTCVALAKDVLAMANTNGGHIVIGVEDRTMELKGVPAAHLNHFADGDTLVNDKLGRFITPVVVHCRTHSVGPINRQVVLALLYVEPAPKVREAAADGNYHPVGGKQRMEFRKGAQFWRRGNASVPVENLDAVPSQQRAMGAIKPTRAANNRVVARPKPKAKNPYDTTYVAPKGMFKGRQAEIDQLLDNLESGTHTAVFGLQRMGKTSLIEMAIHEHLPRRDELKNRVVYVRIDFQQAHYRRYADLFDLFLRSIKDEFKSDQMRTKAEYAIRDFETAKVNGVGHRRQLYQPFATALKGVVGAAGTKKVVLFLDEFSEWCRVVESNRSGRPLDHPRHPHEELVDVDLMQFVSSILRDDDLRDRLVCVFAVRPFMAEYDTQEKLQLLKLVQPIQLYHLDPAAAAALIAEPLRDTLQVEPDAVEYLRNATGGHPYLIQYILKPLVDRCQREGSGRLTLGMVQAECERITAEGPAHKGAFGVLDTDYSVEAAGSSAPHRGQGLLALVARHGDPAGGCWVSHATLLDEMKKNGVSAAKTDELLEQLRSAKILDERADESGLMFRMLIPLLRERYLKQNFYQRRFREKRT